MKLTFRWTYWPKHLLACMHCGCPTPGHTAWEDAHDQHQPTNQGETK